MEFPSYITKVITPDSSNPHNYMLDSCTIARIVDEGDSNIIVRSRNFGYRYYITDVQVRELSGHGAETYYIDGLKNALKNPTEWLNKRNRYPIALEKLLIERVSHIATSSAFAAQWVLDGTVRILDTNSKSGMLYMNIRSLNATDNKKHEYDAIIAEAAMENNCILVTGDKQLLSEVCKLYPNKAIRYRTLRSKINKSISSFCTKYSNK